MSPSGDRIELLVIGPGESSDAVLYVPNESYERIELVDEDRGLTMVGEGFSLWRCLHDLRQQLEADHRLLACAGARRDVHVTQLLEAAYGGRVGFLLSAPRTSSREPYPLVDIFEPAPAEVVATLADQRAAVREFSQPTLDSSTTTPRAMDASRRWWRRWQRWRH